MVNYKWSHRGLHRVKGNRKILLLENENTCCIIMTDPTNTAWFISALMDIFAQADNHFRLVNNYKKGNLMQNQVQSNCEINLFEVELQVTQVPHHKHISVQS